MLRVSRRMEGDAINTVSGYHFSFTYTHKPPHQRRRFDPRPEAPLILAHMTKSTLPVRYMYTLHNRSILVATRILNGNI